MSDPILKLDQISKSYNIGRPNQVTVLRSCNLQIDPGQVVSLVAPSGAGKSTLLHIAGLLDTPDEGELNIIGKKWPMLGISNEPICVVQKLDLSISFIISSQSSQL